MAARDPKRRAARERSSLRPVKAGEQAPAQSRPESVSAAVTDGSPRDVNIAMQDRIAKAIDAEDIRGADLAALSRRLHELRKELAAMDAQAKEMAEDDDVVEDAAWTAI
mgnify:CR=1 FL=1